MVIRGEFVVSLGTQRSVSTQTQLVTLLQIKISPVCVPWQSEMRFPQKGNSNMDMGCHFFKKKEKEL